MADGHRHDGVARYECPKCRRHFSDSSSTSFASSKLTPGRTKTILALITMDCPDWVVAEIAGVNEKTAQFWVDRCLDAASEWSMAIDGVEAFGARLDRRDALGPDEGDQDSSTEYGPPTPTGRIAKDAYIEVAFDASGRGFCHLCASKLGTPSKAMVTECLSPRIETRSTLTRDGASSHNGIVKGLSLADDWVKFIAGDDEYEGR